MKTFAARCFCVAFAAALAFAAARPAFGALGIAGEIIKASTGAVVPGEWNKNFDKARAMADSQNIPLVVFYGGLSCGVCETLQKALTNEAFVAWRTERKFLMVFCTDNSRGNASSFANPNAGGFPYIAVYWNRYGVKPEKNTQYYRTFRGIAGGMLSKDGSLMQQFINSVEMVAGEYPYAGGDFLLPDGETTRLEVEEGYPAGTKVKVPLIRTRTVEYLNKLVCGEAVFNVAWAAGETEKFAEIEIPDGLAAGGTVPVRLLESNGDEHAASCVAVVARQSNSLRNPAWLGEDFAAGEWTMDFDAALARTAAGEFANTLVLFTGVLWCPHCQGLEEGVFGTDTFRRWAAERNLALVVIDNPRRSNSTAAVDYGIREASGAPPTLLRYAAGQNNYLARLESGASYLSRKGIDVGDVETAGTAEFVLRRNRRLGYEWGEGTYCAPDGGRTSYPTLILLERDGTVAGRFNRLEGDSYAHDLDENMARLEALLALSGGNGEADNYPKTTTRALSPGTGGETVHFQVNDRVEFFGLEGLPKGRIFFKAAGAPEANPVTLSVVRYSGGVQTALASGAGEVGFDASEDDDLFLKVEAYSQKRAYGEDAGFTVTVESSVALIPADGTAEFTPAGRAFSLVLAEGQKYRFENLVVQNASVLRDDGEAQDGGHYYTALATGVFAAGNTAATVRYQMWRPGVVAFTAASMTVFKSSGSATVTVVRSGGSSGAVSAKVKVVGGDAVNGERYEWDDETVVSWADGEGGATNLTFRLLDAGAFMPNQTFTLGLGEAAGSAAGGVSANVLGIMICDTDKPTLGDTRYDIPMFATLDASMALEPQTTYNLSGTAKVKLKKIAGKLPAGVKLVYENGKVFLSGTAKTPGSYSYTFAIEQKQGGKVQTGPEITLNFTVTAASNVGAGGNALMDRTLNATLPLYALEDGANVMKGVLEFAASAKNEIKAKFCGMNKKSTSFKGRWGMLKDGLAETGVIQAKDGKAFRMSMASDGAVTAEVVAGDASFSTFGTLKVCAGSYAAPYSGYYTIALSEKASDDPMGDGYLVVKSISPSGKAKWKGMLANGQSISGTAYLTLDDAGCAVLPVFKYRSKDWIAVPLKIRQNGSALLFPRAVKTCDGVVALWSHYVQPMSKHEVSVRGCWYNKRSALDECCYLQFFGTDLVLSAQLDGFESEVFGAAPPSPRANILVTADNLKLNGRCPDIKMSFNKNTGIFKGSMKIGFAKKTISAKFAGVVIPGWHDCDCEIPDPDDPFTIDESQPFALGAGWFSDKKGRTAVNRGFKVKIDERGL